MISIAIDGPAGAGKSSIAKAVAGKLGYIYVDTGALYRSIGYFVISSGFSAKDEQSIKKCLDKINIEIEFINDVQHVFVNGDDVSDKIRTPEVSMAASDVSSFKIVRDFLFELQRSFAKKYNVIMDGRDIGTVVLPNADVKIFLTASPEERAKRRCKDLHEKGIEEDFQKVLDEIIQRDYNDSHREIAPLVPADDSILVDTTGMNLEQSTEKILSIVKEKI